MAASRLVCVATAISPQFVLTTAQCVLARTGARGEVKYLQQVGASQTFISLHRVVIHHQWALGWDLALIETKTRLPHFICLPVAPLHHHHHLLHHHLRAVQVGLKLSNLDRPAENLKLFYQNITLPSQPSGCQGPACTGHPDLHKWVEIFDGNTFVFLFTFAGQVPGSLVETQTRPGSEAQIVGMVSGQISDGSHCSPPPRLVRLDTEKCIQWIASVSSENIPWTEVL